MHESDPPYDPVDLEDLWNALIDFSGKVPSILTEDVLLPKTLSAPVWKALRIVDTVLDELRLDYGFKDKWSVFGPIEGVSGAGFIATSPPDKDNDAENTKN